jgi:hypothetical protein
MGGQASQARARQICPVRLDRPGTTTHHLPWAGVKMVPAGETMGTGVAFVSPTIQETVQAGLAALPAPMRRVYAFSAS